MSLNHSASYEVWSFSLSHGGSVTSSVPDQTKPVAFNWETMMVRKTVKMEIRWLCKNGKLAPSDPYQTPEMGSVNTVRRLHLLSIHPAWLGIMGRQPKWVTFELGGFLFTLTFLLGNLFRIDKTIRRVVPTRGHSLASSAGQQYTEMFNPVVHFNPLFLDLDTIHYIKQDLDMDSIQLQQFSNGSKYDPDSIRSRLLGKKVKPNVVIVRQWKVFC